jgi:hypothetical protein
MKPHLKALHTDTFHCTITSNQGCTSHTTQAVAVTLYDSIRWVTQSDTLLEVTSQQKDTLYWYHNGKLIRANKQNQLSHPDTGWYHACTGVKKRMGQVGCIQCVEGYYVSPRMASTHKFGDQTLRIYPNPARDVLYIEAPETVAWRVCSLQGILMLEGKGHAVVIRDLAPGNYIISAGTQRQWFIKL